MSSVRTGSLQRDLPISTVHGGTECGEKLSRMIAPFTRAFDRGAGRHVGHALQTCVVGMRLGQQLQLPDEEMRDLYYALLLKDAGEHNDPGQFLQMLGMSEFRLREAVASHDWHRVGWTHFQYMLRYSFGDQRVVSRTFRLSTLLRAKAGIESALIARKGSRSAWFASGMGLGQGVVDALYFLGEAWNGSGQPEGLKHERIPLIARIVAVAESVADLYEHGGPEAALDGVQLLSGTRFDPGLATAATLFLNDERLWSALQEDALLEYVVGLEPAGDRMDGETIDRVCGAVARLVDSRFPYTEEHSARVSRTAVAIGRQMYLTEAALVPLQRAALLHEMGSFGVAFGGTKSSLGLPADEQEMPAMTDAILRAIPGFGEVAEIVSRHRERLNGGDGLVSLPVRILAVADAYEELVSDGPQWAKLSGREAVGILWEQVPDRLDRECLAALVGVVDELLGG